MSSSTNHGTWENGVYTVRRDRVHRWYPVIDRDGVEHRWLLRTNEVGASAFAETHRGPRISPIFHSPLSIINWLRTNGYTPKGSRSDTWTKTIANNNTTTYPGTTAEPTRSDGAAA